MLRITDETQRIKAALRDELKQKATLEQFWQKKLEGATGLRHERLEHGLITDLSDYNVLIEIKNACGFREAFGQIALYSYLKSKRGCSADLKKIIVIFNPDWTDALKRDYEAVCAESGISLVLLDDRHVEKDDYEPLLKHIRGACKNIGVRERLSQYRYRGGL